MNSFGLREPVGEIWKPGDQPSIMTKEIKTSKFNSVVSKPNACAAEQCRTSGISGFRLGEAQQSPAACKRCGIRCDGAYRANGTLLWLDDGIPSGAMLLMSLLPTSERAAADVHLRETVHLNLY